MAEQTITCEAQTSDGRTCGCDAVVLHKHVHVHARLADDGSHASDHEIHYMIECPQCGIRTQVQKP